MTCFCINIEASTRIACGHIFKVTKLVPNNDAMARICSLFHVCRGRILRKLGFSDSLSLKSGNKRSKTQRTSRFVKRGSNSRSRQMKHGVLAPQTDERASGTMVPPKPPLPIRRSRLEIHILVSSSTFNLIHY